MQRLEQTLEMYQPIQIQRNPEMGRTTHTVVNLESLSASALYTGEPCGISGGGFSPAPIGSFSDFKKEGPQNISIETDLGQYAPEAKGFTLNERYDALNNGHSEGFHLNYDLTGVNSGTSKKNEDGFKGLGPAHNIPLFDLGKYNLDK